MATGIEAIDRSVDAAAERVLRELAWRLTSSDEVLVAAYRWQDAKLARDRDRGSGSSIVGLADAEASALASLWDAVTTARQAMPSALASCDDSP